MSAFSSSLWASSSSGGSSSGGSASESEPAVATSRLMLPKATRRPGSICGPALRGSFDLRFVTARRAYPVLPGGFLQPSGGMCWRRRALLVAGLPTTCASRCSVADDVQFFVAVLGTTCAFGSCSVADDVRFSLQCCRRRAIFVLVLPTTCAFRCSVPTTCNFRPSVADDVRFSLQCCRRRAICVAVLGTTCASSSCSVADDVHFRCSVADDVRFSLQCADDVQFSS